MLESIRRDVVRRLTDPDFQGVEKGPYIQKIACPDCHKREAWAYGDKPTLVFCGRMDNCGNTNHVRDLFPEIFERWSERAKPSSPDVMPDAMGAAKLYLTEDRHFELDRIRGQFLQESFYSERLQAGTATVRFTLPNGATWERFIDRPHRFGKQKARFSGDYKGEAWQMHADVDFVEARAVWITEGIFDAIALAHAGIPAIAAMSCNNYPGLAMQRIAEAAHAARQPLPKLIWALDSNRAGRRATQDHVAKARDTGWECCAAQPPVGRDWSDLHRYGLLDPVDIKTYRYYGDLLLAPTPADKGRLMYMRREQRQFWFEYHSQLYWFELDVGAYDKAVKAILGEDSKGAEDAKMLDKSERDSAIAQSAKVSRICTAMPYALYYQANAVTDEAWYYWRVDLPAGASVKNTFTGGQLSSASEFKKRILGVAAGAVFTGSSQQLDRLLQDQVGHIKTVETIDFVGYSRDHAAWVLGDLAVANGRVYRQTSEDYFNLGRLRLKTLSQSAQLTVNGEREKFTRRWVGNLVGAYGAKGVVALAFWTGALFAEQIRARHKSFPFLEIVGEPGTGKSTLIEFLWKLCGRQDYEGFDPAKASMPARARNFAQVSNLPVVLIESDRDAEGGAKQRQFDWDELKTAYNGRSIRARGVKNSGNETYEPPFRGAIVISQNAEVQASPAIQSRICHIKTTIAGQTAETKRMAEALEREPVEAVSGYILEATIAEKRILEMLEDRVGSYEDMLLAREGVSNLRIAKNHAQLLTLVEALGPDGLDLVAEEPMTAACQRVIEMAEERQQSINADHPLVEEFWDAYEYIESLYDGTFLNHAGQFDDKGRIAINLKEFEAECSKRGLHSLPPMKEVKRYLKSSKSRRFIESNTCIRSRVREGATVRCWIFSGERS